MFKMNLIPTLILAVSLVVSAQTAQAKSYEIQSMKQILPLIDQNTLVVFDIDNTILQPTQMLGSDQWAMNEISRFKAQGLDDRSAKDKGVAQFAQVQMKTNVQPVEKINPALIRYLQKNRITTFALTARPLVLAHRSDQELQSIGVQMHITAPKAPLQSQLGTDPTVYNKGILLVGPHNNKGTVLANFIKNFVHQPITKIVFIDDKVGNVQNVEEGLKDFSIPHFELRYSAADAYVKAFDSRIGDLQWNIFKQNDAIISDAQALQIISNRR